MADTTFSGDFAYQSLTGIDCHLGVGSNFLLEPLVIRTVFTQYIHFCNSHGMKRSYRLLHIFYRQGFDP